VLERARHQKFLKVATWNVRTLLVTTQSKHPERRTAIIDRELDKLDIDIAALSETRLVGEGSLKEENYSFFWKGYPQKRRNHYMELD
jgi:hypothetical protein